LHNKFSSLKVFMQG